MAMALDDRAGVPQATATAEAKPRHASPASFALRADEETLTQSLEGQRKDVRQDSCLAAVSLERVFRFFEFQIHIISHDFQNHPCDRNMHIGNKLAMIVARRPEGGNVSWNDPRSCAGAIWQRWTQGEVFGGLVN
jgi:hypothetical protein